MVNFIQELLYLLELLKFCQLRIFSIKESIHLEYLILYFFIEILRHWNNLQLIKYLLMSKFLVLFFAALVVCSMASSFDNVNALIKQDECASKAMDVLRPELEAKIAQLKQDPENLALKTELLVLVEKANAIAEKCNLNKKIEPLVGDALKSLGIGMLLTSNCTKDLGIVFLLLDTIVEDPSDITNDIIVLIFTFILGNQSWKDCGQLWHFIHQ